MLAKIRYNIATYSGIVEVAFEDPDTEDACLIATAKRLLSRGSPLPFGAQSFKVIERVDEFERARDWLRSRTT